MQAKLPIFAKLYTVLIKNQVQVHLYSLVYNCTTTLLTLCPLVYVSVPYHGLFPGIQTWTCLGYGCGCDLESGTWTWTCPWSGYGCGSKSGLWPCFVTLSGSGNMTFCGVETDYDFVTSSICCKKWVSFLRTVRSRKVFKSKPLWSQQDPNDHCCWQLWLKSLHSAMHSNRAW